MGLKTYLNIGASCMEFESLEELKIEHKLNEHGFLSLTAVVQEKESIERVINSNLNTVVSILISEDNEESKVIFTGIVKRNELKRIQMVHYLFLEVVTASYETDIELKSRSFQNTEQTYEDLFKQIIKEDYPGGDIIDSLTNSQKIETFIMQYRETDWDFIKRLASKFNGCIVPYLASDVNKPKIFVGIPSGEQKGEIEKYNYYITKDISRYILGKANQNKEISELDTVEFHIETEEDYNIGDMLTYKDRLVERTIVNLYIKKKEIEMKHGVLRYRYVLSTKGSFKTDKLYNERIVGLSLRGTVLKRVQDRVKVHLEIDNKQEIETAWEFAYTTPYTAEGNAGWYFMPEEGDTVLIYFPNEKENEGVGLNSIRVGNVGTDKISDPTIKYLRTIDGKEIKLAPDEIVITCGSKEGNNTHDIYIQLNDKNGIIIQSSKAISINSDSDINFTADKNLILQAKEKILMKCKSSQIVMDDSIELVSKLIKEN